MELQSSFRIHSFINSCDGLHRDAGEELGHLVRRTHHPDPPPALHPEPDRELELLCFRRSVLLDGLDLLARVHCSVSAVPLFRCKVPTSSSSHYQARSYGETTYKPNLLD